MHTFSHAATVYYHWHATLMMPTQKHDTNSRQLHILHYVFPPCVGQPPTFTAPTLTTRCPSFSTPSFSLPPKRMPPCAPPPYGRRELCMIHNHTTSCSGFTTDRCKLQNGSLRLCRRARVLTLSWQEGMQLRVLLIHRRSRVWLCWVAARMAAPSPGLAPSIGGSTKLASA